MRKILFALTITAFHFTYSQNLEIHKGKIEYYEYSENVSFKIKRMKEHKKGGFGFIPLRGFTSYKFYLTFENHSSSEQIVNLDSIYMANQETKKRYKIKWFNTSGFGSKLKPTFKLRPDKRKTFIVFYIFEKNQKPYFLVNNKLKPITHND